jgi:hypothetical protein
MKGCETKMKFEEAQYNFSTLLKIKNSQEGMVAIKLSSLLQQNRVFASIVVPFTG